MKIKLNLCRVAFILLTASLLLASGCSKKKGSSTLIEELPVDKDCAIINTSPLVKRSTYNTTSALAVEEITQTAGVGGYYTGSFVVPSNAISFLLSIFKESYNVKFNSLTDPDGTNILSNSSTPNLYNDASGSLGGYGYANVLLPQSPNFTAKPGTWTFKANNNDGVKIITRTGSAPSDNTTILVQSYITATTWSASDISAALTIMKKIYSRNGITLTVKSTITISDTQYAKVSNDFTHKTTSALISQGSTDGLNLFFVQDQLENTTYLGKASGMPGSMGIANSWNGVLIFLDTHAFGTTLDAQLLGETAAHEIGHHLGLFHTTESGVKQFDILSDTLECPRSTQDNNSDRKVSAEECEGYGGGNVMFWTSWSSSSRSAGKKQEVLCKYQQQILKYSPLAR